MLRSMIAAACLYAAVSVPALAQVCAVTDTNPCSALSGPWPVYERPAEFRTIKTYRAASASRACLTADTRAVLAALERRVGPVSIVSTCRPGAVIAGTRRPSFHRYGRAVDFNTRHKAAAIAFLQTQPVFVMTYCRMGHVHFNTGQRGASFCGKRSRP